MTSDKSAVVLKNTIPKRPFFRESRIGLTPLKMKGQVVLAASAKLEDRRPVRLQTKARGLLSKVLHLQTTNVTGIILIEEAF